MQDDPKARAIDLVVARTNRASELIEFERVLIGVRQIELVAARRSMRFVREKFRQDTARVVDQIAKPLRYEHTIDIAWGRLIDLLEIVVGHRMFERDFDCG